MARLQLVDRLLLPATYGLAAGVWALFCHQRTAAAEAVRPIPGAIQEGQLRVA